MTEPIGDSARAAAAPATAKDWLDALAGGTCDEDAFLRAVQPLTHISSDAGWELLSLLDQYYRRGKIKPEVFRAIKSRFEGLLLGASIDIEAVPPAQKHEPIPAAAPGLATASAAAPAGGGAIPVFAARGFRRELAVGDVLRDRYRIKSVLDRGDTGCVFEAVDEYLLDLTGVEPRLAVKVPQGAAADRPELLNQLRREYQHMQTLSHPNILRVHEYDRDGGTAFFTMDLLSGLSLSRVLSARHQVALQRPHAVAIIRAVAAALAHAHAHGVVHGDLNPENIFITDAGEVRVMHFDAAHAPHRTPPIRDGAAAEQKPGATLRYASCQQLEGEEAGTRDDVYALACVVFLLLASRHPFRDQTSLQARMLGMRPTRPAGLTGAQWRALRLGLDFDREHRPADVEKWLIPFDGHGGAEGLPALLELLRVSTPERGRQWPSLPLAAGIAAMLAIGWGVWTNVDSITAAAARLRQMRHRTADAESSAEPSIAQSPAAAAPARTTPLASPASPASPAPARAPPALASARAPPAPPPPAHVPLASAPPATNPRSPAAALASAPRVQRSRIELSAAAVEVPPAESTAQVVVRRSGNVQGGASFYWWTESGTAKPGQDFMPVARHEESMGSGKGAVNLLITLVADSTRRQPKSFYVVISDPSDGASLGARTVTMVTIPPAQ